MGGLCKDRLDGITRVIDVASGEVLGKLKRERRTVVEADPEGRPGKLWKLPAVDGDTTGPVVRSAAPANHKGVHTRRRELRDAIWKKLENTRRDLSIGGYLVEKGLRDWELRELLPGELVSDHMARLRVEYPWLEAAHRGLGKCCTHPILPWVTIQEKSRKGHCLGGLAHCDRYICPICAPARAADNREKLLAVLDQIPQDAQLVLKVFTSRHRMGRSLARTEREQRDALAALYGHRQMKESTYGNVKTLEITWGDNGFHPHRNVLEAYRPEVDLEDQRKWEEKVYTAKVLEAGGTVDFALQPDWFGKVNREEIAQKIMYITKDGTQDTMRIETEEVVDFLAESITHELTGGYRKTGKSTVPITEAPPEAYAETWCLKHLTWFSRSGCFLRKEVAETTGCVDQPEDEPVDRERMGPIVAWISKDLWRALGAAGRWEITRQVEDGWTPEGFLAWMKESDFCIGFGLGPPPEEGQEATRPRHHVPKRGSPG